MRGTTNLPYVRHEPLGADVAAEYVGGQVIRALAGAALLIGDVVYWSAANTVNKSATTAAYAAFAGVVVGGANTFFQCIDNDADLGITAADTGEEVLVQISGIAWVLAAAATAAGATVGVVTTSGRVDDSTATAGAYVGTSITAAINAADPILIQIAHR